MTIKERVRIVSTVTLAPVEHTSSMRDLWLTWLSDPDVHLWWSGRIPETAKDVDAWLYSATTDPKKHYFSILADGTPIGIINLRQDQVPFDTAEIGIIIGSPENRSRRIGTEALRQATEYARDTLHCRSVRAHIRPDNEKSLKLFIGAGFVHTADVTISSTPMLRFEKMV